MTKVTYSSLKLKTKEDIKEIDFNGSKIEVKQYLPISDKIDLIGITLQESKEGNLYNPLKVDMFFNLNIIYLYTNLTFTDKQKEDIDKLYDTLLTNGLIDAVIAAIPENEYKYLLDMANERVDKELQYSTTTAALVSKFINDLPAQAEAMQEILNNFDQDKFQNVINFAKAANGGRDI
jgi:hypothetical protein